MNFINFSSDAIFLTSAFIIFFAFTLYFGRGKMISLVLAYYPAILLYSSFPFAGKLMLLHGSKIEVYNRLAIFLLFLIPLSLIINKYIYSDAVFSGALNLFKNLAVSLILVALLLVLSHNIPNFDILHNFSAQIDQLFANSTYIFYWNLAPFIALALI